MQTPDVTVKRLTKFEELAFYADGTERPSKFGGTDIERAADNAAAELGFSFDFAQVRINIPMYGSYTLVDRYKRPSILVYLDGPQHDIRVDSQQQDFIQKMALESMGYTVLRLKYVDMLRDPIGTIRQVLYAV